MTKKTKEEHAPVTPPRTDEQAAPRYADVCESVLETIGWTPLIRLRSVVDGARTPVYAKAEFFNPGGSVKDRIGLAMLEAAEREGKLGPGGTVVEGTSGNTGVGLAIAAALKGYRCIFTMPDKMSQEKIRLLRAFGAEVIITPTAVPPEHPDNYIQVAKRIVRETPGAFLADQFYNAVNPQAHYETTGPEIWRQTGGRITHLVASAGTGGTISGAGRYLKERNPQVRVIAGDPTGSVFARYFETGEVGERQPYMVEGIGNDKIPTTLWFDAIDDFHTLTDRESFHMARRITREEGLFVGGSAGLIVQLAVRIAREIDDPDACLVCVLPDTGERYLSKIYDDAWMRENRLLEAQRLTAADMIVRKEAAAPALVSIEPGRPVREALDRITEHDISQLPVIHHDECVGSLSEATLMARVIEDPEVLAAPVDQFMDPPFPIVETDVDMSVLGRLLTRQNPAVLVRESGKLVGIVTRYDMVGYLLR